MTPSKSLSNAAVPRDRTAQHPARAAEGDAPILAVLASFVVLSVLWAVRVPVPIGRDYAAWWNYNPDEGIHIRTIIYMAAHHSLAPHIFAYAVTIHPPLYHALAAVIYALTAPFLGMAHALLLLRLCSCAMGATVVWLTYKATGLFFSRKTGLLAAGFVGGLPMFLSLSPEISNEGLSSLIAAAALYTMALGIKRGFGPRRTLTLSVLVAAGILTKLTCLALLPAAAYVLWRAWRREAGARVVIVQRLALLMGTTLVLDGWWFVRNQLLYGAPVKATLNEADWSVFQPNFHSLGWGHRQFLTYISWHGWESFLGQFDAQNIALPPAVLLAFLGLQICACVGLWRLWRSGGIQGSRAVMAVAALIMVLIVTAIYVYFSLGHLSPQGRYFFPLLLLYGLAMAAGCRRLLRAVRLRDRATMGVLAFLLLLNIFCVFHYPHRTWPLPPNYVYPPKMQRMMPPPPAP